VTLCRDNKFAAVFFVVKTSFGGLIMEFMSKDLDMPPRLLLGPGPSAVHPRVLRAMNAPLVGYLDPAWLAFMDEEQELLRRVFQTKNAMTFPMPGTGSAGMETAFCNFVKPGDKVLIGCSGYFSDRMCEMARLYGADVKRLEKPWGEVFAPEEIEAALQENKNVKILALIHAETSTGALQPLAGIGEIVHKHHALLLLDCVTSLGGTPLYIDDWGIDIAYSATQKCLGCPPGLAPFTLSPRASDVLHGNKTPVPNWYLDLTLIEKYWSNERVYHHTPSTTLHYGFREGY
jgi:alanine-glyoxylate transaminase / serine-glyoxylate transaminase / serine-pyruvate transaminase